MALCYELSKQEVYYRFRLMPNIDHQMTILIRILLACVRLVLTRMNSLSADRVIEYSCLSNHLQGNLDSWEEKVQEENQII